MSARERFAATTAALAQQTALLDALAVGRDQIRVKFDAALVSVQAAHAAGRASDQLPELERLQAGLDNIESLALGVIAEIDALLEQGDGDGVG